MIASGFLSPVQSNTFGKPFCMLTCRPEREVLISLNSELLPIQILLVVIHFELCSMVLTLHLYYYMRYVQVILKQNLSKAMVHANMSTNKKYVCFYHYNHCLGLSHDLISLSLFSRPTSFFKGSVEIIIKASVELPNRSSS